jgi:hypothetical protein
LLATNQTKDLGMKSTIFAMVWAETVATCYLRLFSDKYDSITWVKVVSLLLGMHGSFFL